MKLEKSDMFHSYALQNRNKLSRAEPVGAFDGRNRVSSERRREPFLNCAQLQHRHTQRDVNGDGALKRKRL